MQTSFRYEPDTGKLFRLVRMGNYPAGSECCALTTNKKYRKVKYVGRDWLMHRLIWELHTGEPAPVNVDHRDLCGLNNKWNNLRAATTSTNQMNIEVHTRNLLGVKGIFPIRGGTLYRAEVCIDGKRHQKHSKDVAVLTAWIESKRVQLHGAFTHH
jgi:hypothetical protein